MAYTAYLNDNLFFSTSSNLNSLALLSAELELQAGQAGTFTFSLAPDNVAYNSFAKLTSYVDVYRDTVLLFSGRVIEIREDFTLIRTIVCEGLLAVLADSVFRPITFQNDTLQNLVGQMIASHNSQVDSSKQLVIGTIDIDDAGDYIYRAYEDYDTTISRLMDLVESYGGYMTVNKAEGVLYFNWVQDFDEGNDQGINFGENLLDLTQEESATDIITILVPLGAQIQNEDGSQTRLTIASVNNNNDYLENSAYYSTYGKVVGIHIWDDVTVPSILKSKGQSYLNAQVVNKVTINVNAADLAYTDSNIDYFMVGQTIYVTSVVHGLNNVPFVALEQSLNLLDPSQDRMVLGNTVKGYINTLQKAVKNNTNKIETVTSDFSINQKQTNDRINGLQNQVTQQSSAIEQLPESIMAEVATYVKGAVGALSSTVITQDSESWTAMVNRNNELMTYVTIDEDGLWIGKGGNPIRLLEQNDAIKFIDDQHNVTYLEINTEGIITPSVSASEQVAFLAGTDAQWAIRKGAVSNGKYNLNDLWIGG